MTDTQAVFPGSRPARPPLPEQPECHFDAWPADPDGVMQDTQPIGSAYDGPDSSGKPLSYGSYLVYGFDVIHRRLWVEPDAVYEPSESALNGYVARAAERRMNGIYPYRFWLPLSQLRRASVHHRTDASPSSLHTSRCDHPLVRNGDGVDRHRDHDACYELLICNHRGTDLLLRARWHGEKCTTFRILSGLCEEAGKQRAMRAAHAQEHAVVRRTQDGAVILTSVAGVKP
ncbi:hypothetical protein [Streptomyces yaizuensis]|uniref:Uncharacterized protein n=1 Tax=Streptomyces yaizuensis TaxID=2989713 RepID=A0AA86JBI3_9ACTN|nr:hypothetical protein [Streptomyces sp. YSPA8]BDT39498.1 hypothetical protein SYYSPA8_36900 [Streptomyces sp. YSPA8]